MKNIALFFSIALLLSACSSQAPIDRPLYVGDDGVALTFPRENALTHYEGDLFSVSLRLENDGAADVEAGWITASFDPAVVEFNQSKLSSSNVRYVQQNALPMRFELDGRSVYVSVGEVDYADFTFIAHTISGNRDKASSSITFQACYPYTTTFLQTVCIDRDVYNQQANKVCLERTVSGSSQGAPVAVTRVQPLFLYDGTEVQPRFKITLTNLQSGYTLWARQITNDGRDICNQSEFNRAEFGNVQVNASINNVALQCGTSSTDFNGVVRFDGRTAEIICTYQGIQPGANYEAPLVIQAQYFYVSSLKADLEVTNVN